ncbi:MAG: V-type ATP synthase subunit D [Elusimicrobia bacterium RIFOXYB2_FULL_49_7]|nr:MAG: V-type ATP synthase subunit D [Elusimicrobia bacterium RIFOXYB2_FULL_49_7]
MAFHFQYNKTYLQTLNKALLVRKNALPTLKAKESALRLEVKKAREETERLRTKLSELLASTEPLIRLFSEFPKELVRLSEVKIGQKKVAGIKTPVLEELELSETLFGRISSPAWFPNGLDRLKSVLNIHVSIRLSEQKNAIIEHARKKTTQKVNLYEKVQIPELDEALRKIKRFLEDDENLAKSSQKILKARLAVA